ncbi:Kidney mitochondrial carrier protein 1 [Hondaea fermentalgiana]|uniref:Kidney mitochondrial carrier protein 1 n=1 Tax=Hondaea fermentalgiana TaxID=2315210 RepID=A0A2R5GDK5_9STRA|nr:Kidney mitochondrial carrier protein 1 [Hondaea fermentalgiana]|eukprot:GBG26281.1 Kidney mitochondrial carrier protein 1 [Hondaea fermentalgiana]
MGGEGSPLMELAKEMGLAGATAIIVVNGTHPIDMVKTRMQINSNFSITAMVKEEGVRSLYKGLPAALCREAAYTSIKLGCYQPIKNVVKSVYFTEGTDTKKELPFVLKFASGSAAGVLGSFFGNPFDVLKTRMISNTGKSVSLGSAISNVHQERGITGFWRGLSANALRACVLNGTKLAVFDVSKGFVVEQTGLPRKDPRTVFLASACAGVAMTLAVAPIDMIRTKLMNASASEYNGLVDCVVQTVKKDGPLSLYRGSFMMWARFGPQATGQLVVFEFLRNIFGLESI